MQTTASSYRRCQRGFTLLELVVVIIIFAVLMGTYLRATRYYQEQAEQVAVGLTLSHIKVGMAQEWIERISKGTNRQQVAELVGVNPIRWLEAPPPGYLGEMKAPQPERLAGGSWYFDLTRRELVYLVKTGDYLEFMDGNTPKVLQWSIRQAQNASVASPAEFGELALEPVRPYKWF